MVIADLNIVCVGQVSAVSLTYDKIGIDVLADHNGYGHHWMKLKKTCGIWYQVYPLRGKADRNYDDEFFNGRFCGDSWYVIPYHGHLAKIEAILATYIALSPIEEILRLIRLDEHGESENEETICYDEFREKLHAEKIRFNTIYRISK